MFNINVGLVVLIVASCFGKAIVSYGFDRGFVEHQNDSITIKECLRDSVNILKNAYYPSGNIESSISYADTSKYILNGPSKYWYENGKLKRDLNYCNDKREGVQLTYWPNGNLKRKDLTANDELISGNCWDENGGSVKYYEYEIMPEFIGKVEALYRFLGENMVYPKKARRKNIQGKVYTTFLIEESGFLSNIEILKGVHPSLDAEAVRVIQMMPKWKPGMIDGDNVKVQFNLPINFIIK